MLSKTLAPHRLDPLAAEEIERAAAIVRAQADGLGERIAFVTITAHEPGRGEDAAPARRAEVVLVDRDAPATCEALVDLSAGRLEGLRRVAGAHAAFTADEMLAVDALVKGHPDFAGILARRGLRPEQVEIGLFPAGNRDLSAHGTGRRLCRTSCWLVDGRRPYTAPVEGIVAIVDLDAGAVLSVDDYGVVPVAPPALDYEAASVAPARPALRPLHVAQPEGPSFALEGHALRWEGWSMRLGFTPREGLVLHTVSHRDGDRDRPVLHRASLAEMVVPYGDSSPNHHDRSVFDVGEACLGLWANELELGCDCLGEIRYLDAVVNDARGDARTIRNAICVHEEDDGVLWKHTDAVGHREVRRSRKLVVSWFATLDNYDYGFYWSFRQDGSVELEVKLTGIVLVAGVAPGVRPRHGELVAEGLNGLLHQHFFCVRLHMDVDGGPNSVCELEARATPPGPENPYGNAFETASSLLSSEAAAQRLVDPLAARRWKVVNPTRANALGGAPGYVLHPGENVAPLAQPEAGFARRAGFTRRHLWVTPYDPAERYPAGEYPNLHAGGDGLPAWTAADRPLVERDLVLWYCFGHHHIPRPEDWPVMPVARIGFHLKPSGFFDHNPANDVAPPDRDPSGCGA